LPGVTTDAVFGKARGELAELLEREAGARTFVLVDGRGRAFGAGNLDRNDLFGEVAVGLRCQRALLTCQRELVAGFARDRILLGKILGGDRHRRIAVRVGQCRPERIFELSALPERKALARAAHDVRRLAHILAAAGQRVGSGPQRERLRGRENRLQARAAEPVEGEGRNVDRQSSAQAHVTGKIDRVGAGLHHVAEDDFVDLLLGHPTARDRGLGGGDGEIGRGQFGEHAAEVSERGPGAGDDDDVGVVDGLCHIDAAYSSAAEAALEEPPGRHRRRVFPI
jgi:hypothetical protein